MKSSTSALIIVLIVAALLLGQFLCNTLLARVLLFLLSAPLSIAVNVLRVAGTAILADYNEQFAVGFYHAFAGWLVFVVGFLAFVGIAKLAHATLERGTGYARAVSV